MTEDEKQHADERPAETIILKVKRRPTPDAFPHWDEIEVPTHDEQTVLGALASIPASPTTRDGRPTSRPAFAEPCLDQRCGRCAMIVNGLPQLACRALVSEEPEPIELRPLTVFPVVQDLVVDRGRLVAHLARAAALVDDEARTALAADAGAACIACGLCLEACPTSGPASPFAGAAVVYETRRAAEANPAARPEALDFLAGDTAAEACGNAQACERACPVHLPLLDALGATFRALTLRLFR